MKFKSTKEIKVEKRIIDQVIGQDDAVKIMKKAASQRRHVLLIGEPGTGKSMLIAAIATKLKEHSDALDIPFLFHPMPDTLISTFQGGSAAKMVEWMKPMQDPTKLIFAPIDDAENNLQERTAQGVSAGVKEVIGVFLRYTEGAYAVNYGNSSIGLFTNLPEMLDKAVISRVQGRFKIDGARNEKDFVDQDYLWWKKLEVFFSSRRRHTRF